MYWFDPMYFVFLLPALALSMWAQWRVKSTYQKYSQVPNQQHIPGARAARLLLDSAGLSHIAVEHVPGELSDHYDPSSKTLRLSDGVINNASVAALGIVAHECGHAVQDAKGYALMRARSAMVPAVNIGQPRPAADLRQHHPHVLVPLHRAELADLGRHRLFSLRRSSPAHPAGRTGRQQPGDADADRQRPGGPHRI